MKFPSYGLVYDYSLEDGGVSRKHSKDDDDEDHHTGEVRGRFDILTRDGRGGGRGNIMNLSFTPLTLKLSPVFILLKIVHIFVWHLEC